MENLICQRTELTITHRCTLQCKLCGAYSPYYSPTPHWQLHDLCQYIDRYFEVVDGVEKLTISGGEPFLHEDIDKLTEYLGKYSDRISLLEFITNGTICPSDSFIRAMKAFGAVKVIVDNYGPSLSGCVNEVDVKLTENDIFHEVRKYYGENQYYNGWIDMSDLSMRKRTQEETSKVYHSCIFSKNFQRFLLVEGKIYLCATARRCECLSLLKQQNCIDLFDTRTSIEEKREQIRTFFNREAFEACSFCDGFVDTYKRYAPAEQL